MLQLCVHLFAGNTKTKTQIAGILFSTASPVLLEHRVLTM